MRKGSVITHDMNATNVAICCLDDVFGISDFLLVNSLDMFSKVYPILIFFMYEI